MNIQPPTRPSFDTDRPTLEDLSHHIDHLHNWLEDLYEFLKHPVFHTMEIGDATSSSNYVSFANDGFMTLYGDARAEQYMVISPANIIKGATAPDSGTIGVFPVLLFASNLTEEARFSVHLPVNWADGSKLEVAIYWAPTDANTGTVAWEFDWEAVASEAGEVLGVGSTHVDLHDDAKGTSNELLETSYGDISGALLTSDDTIGIHFYRDHDDASDNYGVDAALVHIEIEHIIDRLGDQ